MSALLRRVFRQMLYATPAHRLLPKGVKHDKAYWDKELAGRLNAYLGGTLTITARNAVTMALVAQFAGPPKSLLDLGCASGSLYRDTRHLQLRYVGVDISETAISEGRKSSPGAEFHIAGLEDFEPKEKFDVIVMNEVLYYFDPTTAVSQVERFTKHLSATGCFVISMKHDAKSEAIFAAINQRFTWVSALLFQEKNMGPDFRIRFNNERPAYLAALVRPKSLTQPQHGMN